MKQSLLIPLALVFLMDSCVKDDLTLEHASELVRGKYSCISMTWDGAPIDLDGDGECHSDLLKEFLAFEYTQSVLSRPVRIYPANAYDRECPFSVEIPMQAIRYEKATEQYELLNDLLGDACYMHFSYTVHDDGSLSFLTSNDQMDINRYREGDWEIDYVDYLYTQGECVLSLNDGILSVRIIGAYYDFQTEKLVTGPVDLVYERVSYSVN